MNRFLVALKARLVWFLLRLLLRLPDGLLGRLVRPSDSLPPTTLPGMVRRDLAKIFGNPESARLARRLIREARPAQALAVLRGAFRLKDSP